MLSVFENCLETHQLVCEAPQCWQTTVLLFGLGADICLILLVVRDNFRCDLSHFPNPNKVQKESFHFLKKILFIFRERGREGEREGEKH